jgi:DNA-binding MarR family transcriptional regulator
VAISRAPSVPSPDAPLLAGKDQLNDLLWEVTTYAELIGELALAETPLTLPSSGMLVSVLAEPGITVAEMSRRIPKTQQAISQVAARLEKLGLIERKLGSGRGVGLFVTETGREMAQTCLEREREYDARLRQLIGDERYEQLRQLLIESRTILRGAR